MFEDLLDQLKDGGTTGGGVPSENLAKMLADAESMVKEMENRNFTPQKKAAVKERDEAEKCKLSKEKSVICLCVG